MGAMGGISGPPSRVVIATAVGVRWYRAWEGRLSPTMRQSHPAGERMFVDYAGQTVELDDGRSGEIRQAQIFVAVMGAFQTTPICRGELDTIAARLDWLARPCTRVHGWRAACSWCPITRRSASIAPTGMSRGSMGPFSSWRRITARRFCRRARASPRDKAKVNTRPMRRLGVSRRDLFLELDSIPLDISRETTSWLGYPAHQALRFHLHANPRVLAQIIEGFFSKLAARYYAIRVNSKRPTQATADGIRPQRQSRPGCPHLALQNR